MQSGVLFRLEFEHLQKGNRSELQDILEQHSHAVSGMPGGIREGAEHHRCVLSHRCELEVQKGQRLDQ